MTDFELLHEYASRSSDAAFGQLVERYSGLVYSAALRQMRHPLEAEEVAQVVFIILARKAASLGENVILPGWLLRTARFVALNAIRRETHRKRSEEQAVNLYDSETDRAWSQVAPLLDEALSSLNDTDRNAIALRFLEQRSFKEIAQILRTSEDGAQKRVTRALGKLRSKFARSGVTVSSTVIVAALTSNAVHAAPAGLCAGITAGVPTAYQSSLASAAMAALDREQSKGMAFNLSAAGCLIVVGLLVWHEWASPRAASRAFRITPSVRTAAGNPPLTTFPPESVSASGQLLLRVLSSQTESPIRNAKLTVTWLTEFPDIQTSVLSTDARGEALVSFPFTSTEPWNLRIVLFKDGYVPKFISWAAVRGDLPEDIPVQYVARLDPGTIVAGPVVNEDYEPISGVQVGVNGPSSGVSPEPPAEREGVAMTHSETTDAQGRWFCNHLPSQLQLLSFSFSHPEYLSTGFRPGMTGNGAHPQGGLVAYEDLRHGTALTILRRGRGADGIVTDAQGRAVAGARVTHARLFEEPGSTILTDADGKFRFGNIPPQGELTLTAQADGFLPQDITLPQGASSGALRFVMRKAAVLRGRVLDADSHPIPRASIFPVSSDYGKGRFHWSTLTDPQGRFEWLSAPLVPLKYEIGASGFDYRRVDLAADGTEQTLILSKRVRPPRARISGHVTDSDTRQPVTEFQVWTAVTLRQGSSSGFPTYMSMAPKLTTTGENGRFAFLAPTHYAEPVEGVDIEIRADGYLTDSAKLPGPLTNALQLQFQLTPAGGISGTVLLPDGAPASGATVVACTGNDGFSQSQLRQRKVYITLPGEFDLRHSPLNRTETDAQGAFTLKTKPPTGMLCVAHKLGYTEVPLDRLLPSCVIRLQRWGFVSGTFKISGPPGTNRTVFLGNAFPEEPPFLSLAAIAATDESGHFRFEKVPPGEWKLLPHGIPVRVKAGEITEVAAGGDGLRVIGKITPADLNTRLGAEGYRLVLSSRLFAQPAPNAQQFSSASEHRVAMVVWFKAKLAFLQTDAGREALRCSRQYVPVVQPDGSFVVNEALPGNYELKFEASPLQPCLPIPLLDEIIREICVPEAVEVLGGTLDLGSIDLPPSAGLQKSGLTD
jgi:RNA polymerase sigma factor (sigma-70 family)